MSIAGYRSLPAVPGGPRAFRYRIRRIGPLLALVPAAVLGAASIGLLRHNVATARGVTGFAAAVLAAPALMPLGVPLATGSQRLWLGIVVSGVLWVAVGVVAAQRATRSPVAGWGDFWREFGWLAAGIWLGVVLALVGVEVFVGRGLL
jgi:hypothetical protein